MGPRALAEKYMNILARGLNVASLWKEPLCQVYTCSSFEGIRIAVNEKMDSYWGDDTEYFLDNAEEYVGCIEVEPDIKIRCMLAIAKVYLWKFMRYNDYCSVVFERRAGFYQYIAWFGRVWYNSYMGELLWCNCWCEGREGYWRMCNGR